MERIDFKQVAANALARARSIVPELLPGGKFEGNEYVIGDLRGTPGDSLKINVATGLWSDFSSGESGGDIISLAAAVRGCSQLEAAKWLAGDAVSDALPKQAVKKADLFEPILPVPEGREIDPESINHWKMGRPSRTWAYRDRAGRLLNIICRFDKPGGEKEIFPYTYGTLDGKASWHWKQIPDNRPLYGLELLQDKGVVLITEGEKAADAARILTQQQVVTWPGGSKAWKKADFSPLYGRKVVLISDADEPGRACMTQIAEHLHKHKCKVTVALMPDQPGVDGWDAADALAQGMRGNVYFGLIKKYIEEYPTKLQTPLPQAYENAVVRQEAVEEELRKSDILPMGYDREFQFFYSVTKKQVLMFRTPELTGSRIFDLAPLEYWERMYPTRGGVDKERLASDLVMMCVRRGVYDPDKVRGRGAWCDGSDVIFHAGDCLFVNGQPMGLRDYMSKNVYEAGSSLDFNINLPPLTVEECAPVMNACKLIRWEDDLMAYMLAGWCVIAPFCGALRWRPHIWVSAAAGSGKSTVMDNIVSKLMKSTLKKYIGDSSEAGIRRSLEKDALPVILDEAVGEGKRDKDKIQPLLSLVRQASSETGAQMVKGSNTGSGTKSYQIRSCFILFSVGVAIQQYADETRITILSIKTPSTNDTQRKIDEDRYREFQKNALCFDEEYAQRLQNRTLRLIKVIKKNAETFAAAATSVLGSKRAGDQAGPLLAGAYSLHSSKEITLEAAESWIAARDMRSAVTDSTPDYERCFNSLMESKIKVSTGHMQIEVTVGELVDICRAPDNMRGDEADVTAKITGAVASAALSRNGMRVVDDGKYLAVSNDSSGIAAQLRNTTWSSNWKQSLRQNPLAHKNNNTSMSFAGSRTSKVTCVPLPALDAQDRPSYIPAQPNDDIPF